MSRYCNHLLLFVALLFPSLAVWGHPGSGHDQIVEDSLKNFLSNDGIPSEDGFRASYELAKLYDGEYVDSAVKYSNIALSLLPASTPDSIKISLLLVRADNLSLGGDHDLALTDLDQANASAILLNDSLLIGKSLSSRALVMQNSGNFPEAIQYNLQTLSIAESIKDSFRISKSYGQLSVVYGNMEDLDKSDYYDQKCLVVASAIKDTFNLSGTYNNIAVNFELRGQFEPALENYLKAFALTKATEDSSKWTLITYNIGSLSGRVGDLDFMAEYMDLAMDCAQQSGDLESQCLGQLGKAEYFLRSRKREKAEPYIDKALEIGLATGSPSLFSYVYRLLATTGEAGGYYKDALMWTQTENAIKDSLNSIDRLARIEELEMQYETQKKDIANARLQLEQANSEVQRQRTLWLSILLGSGLVIFLGFMIWNNRRKSKRNQDLLKQAKLIQTQNETLQSRNAQLDHLNKEKDALMGIVAHDLKAPLSKAAGLLSILQMRVQEEGTAREVINRMDKVFEQGNSLIEELVLLNELDSNSATPERSEVDVNALVDHSAEAFQEVAARKHIKILVEKPQTPLLIPSHGPYLQRILDNLLSNAFKFSMPHTEVLIRLKPLDASFTLEVHDQGPGIAESEIPQLFKKFTRLSNRPTGGESSTGLGLSIVQNLVERLDGTISVESKLGEGTVFVATFPQA